MNAILIGLFIPFAGTVLGSAFVFLMKKEMPQRLQKSLLGFASGVMVAASVWSLLIPAMEMNQSRGITSVIPAVIGLLAGFAFLLLIDNITPHLHQPARRHGSWHSPSRCIRHRSHHRFKRRTSPVARHSLAKHTRRRYHLHAPTSCR